MAGVGEKRDQAIRRAGEQAPSQSNATQRTVEPNQSRNVPQFSGYEGPSDAQSLRSVQTSLPGPPSDHFGPGLGYDPARDNRISSMEKPPNRLELPAEAYRDLRSSVSSKLFIIL